MVAPGGLYATLRKRRFWNFDHCAREIGAKRPVAIEVV
jgi:hypothetical protein